MKPVSKLPPEAIKEIGLRDDLAGTPFLKHALLRLHPELINTCGGVYSKETLEQIHQWSGDDVGARLESSSEVTPSARGLKMDFPVHALLLHVGAQQNCSREFLRLASHILWIAKALQEAVEGKANIGGNTVALADNRRKVCRRLWLLPKEALIYFSDLPASAEDFYSAVQAIPNVPSIRGVLKTRKAILLCLEYIFGQKRSPHRNLYVGAPGPNKAISAKVWESSLNKPDPDDRFSDEDAFKVRVELDTSGARPRDLKDAGSAPEEALSAVRLIQGDRPVDVRAGESIVTHAYRSRNAYRYVAKNQQFLPSSWASLTPYEIFVLLKALVEERSEDPRARVALLLSLMTGSSLETVARVQLFQTSERVPKRLDAGAVFVVLGERLWGRGVIRPNQAKRSKSQWSRYFEATEAVLKLPIMEQLHSVLVRQIREFPRDLFPDKNGALFKRKGGNIVEPAKNLLSKLNKRHNTRFTALRVEKALFDALSVGEGDRTEAALITGQMPTSGQISSLYYHHVTKPELSTVYTRALSRVIVDMSDKKKRKFIEHGVGIGSEICPKVEPLKLLVKDLRNAIEVSMQPAIGVKAWIDFHNAYTRYVVMMVLFATGHRAVQDPIPYPEDIDWQRGLVMINDKSGDHQQKDRLVPLVPTCREQLELYLAHRQAVIERRYVLTSQNVPEKLPFFFFLTIDLQTQSVGQKTLTDYLQITYDLPLNINRHLLRSSLRRAGIPGTAVDAFMGHWADHQNPFDRFSTMDPVRYYEACGSAIAELFARMGWRALEGLA